MIPGHITILCSRLDLPGGIERAVVNLANLLAEKGEKVTLLILDNTGNSFYPVSSRINIIQQSLDFGITEKGNILTRKFSFLKDIQKLKGLIKKLQPNHIIATDYQFIPALVLTGAKKHSKIYSWEHHEYSWLKKNYFWNTLLKYSYPKLNSVICLNNTEAEHYKKLAPVTVIPNFFENNSGKKSSLNNKTILSVGWLIPRKGIDLMMIAAKEVLKMHPGWQWKIIGDGEMKESLLAFIQKENLENKLIWQEPVSHDLSDEYANTSIFVLASRLEVFGLVLTEAMSFGVPCISFDCPSGPANIITHNEDGILVEKENPSKLAQAISSLITNELQRKKMGEKAIENVKRFSPETIYQLWKEKIFT